MSIWKYHIGGFCWRPFEREKIIQLIKNERIEEKKGRESNGVVCKE
jgi:hypothetical protein